MRLKVSSAKRRPFCLGLNELIMFGTVVPGQNDGYSVDETLNCILFSEII